MIGTTIWHGDRCTPYHSTHVSGKVTSVPLMSGSFFQQDDRYDLSISIGSSAHEPSMVTAVTQRQRGTRFVTHRYTNNPTRPTRENLQKTSVTCPEISNPFPPPSSPVVRGCCGGCCTGFTNALATGSTPPFNINASAASGSSPRAIASSLA